MPLLQFSDGTTFSSGCTGYNTVPGTETTAKITLVVTLGSIMTEAVVDTCIDYVVCAREEGEALRHQSTESIPARIRIHGLSVQGSLHRFNLVIMGDEGEDLELTVQAFIPDRQEQLGAEILPRSLLGLTGCLESMRFAVDPFFEKTFHFV